MKDECRWIWYVWQSALIWYPAKWLTAITLWFGWVQRKLPNCCFLHSSSHSHMPWCNLLPVYWINTCECIIVIADRGGKIMNSFSSVNCYIFRTICYTIEYYYICVVLCKYSCYLFCSHHIHPPIHLPVCHTINLMIICLSAMKCLWLQWCCVLCCKSRVVNDICDDEGGNDNDGQ
jgi:hypothetical protein